MTSKQIRWVLERNSYGRGGSFPLSTRGIEVGHLPISGDLVWSKACGVAAYFRLTTLLTEGRSYPPGLDGLATFTNISL